MLHNRTASFLVRTARKRRVQRLMKLIGVGIQRFMRTDSGHRQWGDGQSVSGQRRKMGTLGKGLCDGGRAGDAREDGVFTP